MLGLSPSRILTRLGEGLSGVAGSGEGRLMIAAVGGLGIVGIIVLILVVLAILYLMRR